MIAVSRQGNLAVINHEKFQIHFNLAKGTWDYIDETGQTIIKNGRTQITLQDGSTVSTEDAGTRKFISEPMRLHSEPLEPLSSGSAETTENVAARQRATETRQYEVLFSHEPAEKGIRLNTYLYCFPDESHIVLKVGIENLGRAPVALDSVTLLGISTNRGAVQLGGQPSGYHLFLNTPPTFAGGGIQRLYDGFQRNENHANPPCQCGILHDTDSRRALVFGFLTTEKWWPQVQVGHQVMGKESPGINRWCLYHQCERYRCKKGEEVTSESVYLNFVDGAEAAYRHYTELVAAQNGAQTTKQLVSGWNLLDSEAAEPEVEAANTYLEQTALLAESPLFRPQYPGGITHLQVDATPADVGADVETDIETDIEEMVSHIRARGFKAAIRINPFSVARDSALLRKHPDSCLQKRRTSPRTKEREDVVLLDVSHPKAQAHIHQQFQRFIAEWGCELIQADFSAYTTLLTSPHNMTWHDKSLTSVQLYRLAVQVLKNAVAEAAAARQTEGQAEVLLAGRNLIAAPCIGSFVMNSPVASVGHHGTDTVNWHHQNGTKHRVSQTALHHSEHNTLWNHVFGELKVDEPRPINEAIVEITAAAFAGSAVFCADSLLTLKPHRAELLAKLFPLIGTAAKPVALYDEPFPRIWSLSVSRNTSVQGELDKAAAEKWYLVAVFNWRDHEDDVDFELDALGLPASKKDYLVHDFWMRQYLGTVSESVTLLNIPSRSVKLLCLREEQDVPQLLSTDIHWTQGSVEILSAGWDSKSESYLLVCKPPRQAKGTCFIHVPEDYLPIGMSAYGSEYHYRWEAPICQVTFGPTEQLIHANVRFARTSG